MADLRQGHVENLGRGDGVEVLARQEGLLHGGIAGDMGQKPQLNLAVVGVHQKFSGGGGKHGADLSPQFLAHRDVLEVRLGGGESPCGRYGHLEAGMNPPVRPDYLQKAVGISALELCQGPVVQDLLDDGMAVPELLQHIDVGAPAGFGLLPGRQGKLLEQDLSQLFGGENVEIVPGQGPDLLLQLFDAGRQTPAEVGESLAVHQKARFFHLREHPAKRHLDLFKEPCLAVGFQLFLQDRCEGGDGSRSVQTSAKIAFTEFRQQIAAVGRPKKIGRQSSVEKEAVSGKPFRVQEIHEILHVVGGFLHLIGKERAAEGVISFPNLEAAEGIDRIRRIRKAELQLAGSVRTRDCHKRSAAELRREFQELFRRNRMAFRIFRCRR